MYDQPGVDATTVVNNNGNFLQDLNAPGTVKEGLVGSYIQVSDSVQRERESIQPLLSQTATLLDSVPARP